MPTTDWRELLLWLLRRRQRVRVAGGSMLPLLRDGAEVLVDPNAYGDRSIVKRIVAVLPDNTCILIGDNATASTDSRQFGAIPFDRIIGKVTSRFSH